MKATSQIRIPTKRVRSPDKSYKHKTCKKNRIFPPQRRQNSLDFRIELPNCPVMRSKSILLLLHLAEIQCFKLHVLDFDTNSTTCFNCYLSVKTNSFNFVQVFYFVNEEDLLVKNFMPAINFVNLFLFK